VSCPRTSNIILASVVINNQPYIVNIDDIELGENSVENYKPKIGEECLVSFISTQYKDWCKKTVVWVGKQTIILSDKHTSEYAINLGFVAIKPLPDPVQEMLGVVDRLDGNYDCCRALYDAGYRSSNG